MKSATLEGRSWFMHVHSTSDCILTCALTMAGAYRSTEQNKPHASGAWDHSMSMHEALVIYLTTRRGLAKCHAVAHLIRQYIHVVYSQQGRSAKAQPPWRSISNTPAVQESTSKAYLTICLNLKAKLSSGAFLALRNFKRQAMSSACNLC